MKSDIETNIIEAYYEKIKKTHLDNDRLNLLTYFKIESKKNKLDSLYYYFLGEIYRLKKNYEKAKVYFEKSIKLDEEFALPINSIGNIYLAKKDYINAIEYYKEAIKIDESNTMPFYNIGNAYLAVDRNEKAKWFYEKANRIDPKVSHPYYGLGRYYLKKNEYNKALDVLKAGLDIDKNNPALWALLGNVYSEVNDFFNSEQCYFKAIELDGSNPDYFNLLGNVYYKANQYEFAEAQYNKVLELDKSYSSAYYNLGLIKKNLNLLTESFSYFTKALEIYENAKDIANISQVNKYLLDLNKSLIAEKYLSKRPSAKASLIDTIFKKINESGISEKVRKNESLSIIFLQETPAIESKEESYIEILRRWNSFTPIIADNYRISKGGGYFIKISGKGIVIDPGFNFIDNFKATNHVFKEIDVILISHAHNDHTADLESILTLLHKYNENRKKDASDKIKLELAKTINKDIDSISNEEVDAKLKITFTYKTVEIYLTAGVFMKYSGLFNLHETSNYNIHIIESGISQKILNKIKIEVISAKHNDILSDRHSVGFIIHFNESVIIYTGDTGWDRIIENQYINISKKLKAKKILLIAHLGGFKEYEENFFPNQDYSFFYKNHLGRLGLIKINEIMKPYICLISEFGEELKGSRKEFFKYL